MKRLSALWLLFLAAQVRAAGSLSLPAAPAPALPAAAIAAPLPETAALAAAAGDPARAAKSLDTVAAAVAALPRPEETSAEAVSASGVSVEAALSGGDVTGDFLRLHAAVRAGAAGALPAGAAAVNYRLVGGFLSNHIHDYFRANVERLGSLGLDVRRVPVHTEGRRRQAFQLIERAVRESDKPVVLIAHSRGGTLVHDWYRLASPELKAKVARVLVMQAPMAGTSYIDWYLESRWRRFKAARLGPWVYGVNVLRGLNEITRRTRSWVSARLPAWAPGDLAKFLTVRTSIAAGTDRFYDKDRSIMAAHGEPENDGRVAAESGRIAGARDVFLAGVDHQQLVLQRPDLRRRWNGYAPHPSIDAGDATEALVRLLFR